MFNRSIKLSTLLRSSKRIVHDLDHRTVDGIRSTANQMISERNALRPDAAIAPVTHGQVDVILHALAAEMTPRDADPVTVKPDWPPQEG